MRAKIIILIWVLTILLLLASSALAANGYAITRSVMGGGGGRATGGVYALNGTIGQAVVGSASSGSHTLCTGFWCGLTLHPIYRLHLPLVLRS